MNEEQYIINQDEQLEVTKQVVEVFDIQALQDEIGTYNAIIIDAEAQIADRQAKIDAFNQLNG